MMSSSQSPWIQLAMFKKNYPSVLFSLVYNDNTNELYAIWQQYHELLLAKYSFFDDCWTNIELRQNILTSLSRIQFRHIQRLSATLDPVTKDIYFCNTIEAAKITLDQNNTKAKLNMIRSMRTSPKMGRAPKATIIDGEFHLIGLNNHIKYSDADKQWETVGQIDEGSDSGDDYYHDDHYDGDNGEETKGKYVENHGMIQVNNKVLVFGGHFNNFRGWPWNFNYTDCVREYDINKNEWTKLKVKVPNGAMMGYGTASILDGEYVAVFGGNEVWDGENGGCGAISIYSVKNQTFRRSKIQCPGQGPEWQAISVRNKLNEEKTAYGFVRMQWKELKMDYYFPPKYILSLIAMYYWNEQIHLFGSWILSDGHYKIDAIKLLGD